VRAPSRLFRSKNQFPTAPVVTVLSVGKRVRGRHFKIWIRLNWRLNIAIKFLKTGAIVSRSTKYPARKGVMWKSNFGLK
jgi:hypothetical protein